MMKKGCIIFLMMCASSVLASIEWVKFYDGLGGSLTDEANDIVVDGSGNVYVTGKSGYDGGVYYEYATIKYNSLGNQLWATRYNSGFSGTNRTETIGIDQSGNVYVTGNSRGSDGALDWATVKYNSSGVEQWVERYSMAADEHSVPQDLGLDDSENIIVTGYGKDASSSAHCITIKYKSDGDTVWLRDYDPGTSAIGDALTIDGAGDTYISGRCRAVPGDNNLLALKYSAAGIEEWSESYDGPSGYDDDGLDIVIDGSGNIYTTGYSFHNTPFLAPDCITIKYSPPSAGEVWVERFTRGATDVGNAIALDTSGNIYVTGSSAKTQAWAESLDIVTIKYSPDGTEEWVRIYDGLANDADEGYDIAIDGLGNVYVTGYTTGISSDKDIIILIYDSLGNELSTLTWDSPDSSADVGLAIVVDTNDCRYITGRSRRSGTEIDYVTLKICGPMGIEESSNYQLTINNYQLSIYPNPSTTGVRVKWSGISEKQKISLRIYDLSGRLVKTLTPNPLSLITAVEWDGTDSNNRRVENGVYFVKLAGQAKKIVLIR